MRIVLGRVLGVALAALAFAGGDARALEGEVVIPGPPGSASFGEDVIVLPNGNFVVVDPDYGLTATGQGAVHLYDGATLALVSTLRGASAADSVGGDGVTVLTDGDFVVRSSLWDDAENTRVDAGAATFCSGATGCSGEVSAANSLIGGSAGDLVGRGAVAALSNGNYVVGSDFWDLPETAAANAGAATFCNGVTGCSGAVTPANSLVGSSLDDRIGSRIVALPNGSYLVWSNNWDFPGPPAVANVGAVAFCPVAGCIGAVSAANALVGGTANDALGSPVVLANGNYVTRAQFWDRPAPATVDLGAATWCSGATGCKGLISAANSLIGKSAEDRIGDYVVPLSNGHYVVGASAWDNPVSGAANVGAVTWCNGATGRTGEVTAATSLIGGSTSDLVGLLSPGTVPLTNGSYVVMSPFWDRPAPATVDAGAATWCSGTGGCAGTVVTAANSLTGSSPSDWVAFRGMVALADGSYVVDSPNWDNPAPSRLNVGASTWCSGAGGCAGLVVGPGNSLVGSTADDQVGDDRSVALAGGGYVTIARKWNRLSPAVVDAGAVVRCSAAGGCSGEIDDAEALVGASGNDRVGAYGAQALANGNYVVLSPNVGAVTFCSGTPGCIGEIDATNSLLGASEDDGVGEGDVEALANGDYVVVTPGWDDPGGAANSGAATLGDGKNGTVGLIGAANSIVGTRSDDVSAATYDALRRRLVVGRAPSNAVTVPEPGAQLVSIVIVAALGCAALRRSAPVDPFRWCVAPRDARRRATRSAGRRGTSIARLRGSPGGIRCRSSVRVPNPRRPEPASTSTS